MNYMEQVAKALGIELGEVFYLKNNNEMLPYQHKLTIEGLFVYSKCRKVWDEIPITLSEMLCGKYEIIKKPWKPKEGERYYYIGVNRHGEGTVWDCVWEENDIRDIMRYKLGNCFKTEKEAISNIDACLEWLKSEPLTNWRISK